MKFFRIDLLTLLISLFILSSCKNQDGIGLNPDQQLNGTQLVDTNIVVNTTYEDSVATTGITKTPLGYFKDPQIGTTEANIAMALTLPLGGAYTLPTGTITIDSALLVIKYADGFYGDSLNSKFKLNVYQLTEKPVATQTYFNTHSWGYNSSNLLGTKTFVSRTHTTYKITDIVAGAKDTLKKVTAQLRVPISSTFINNILFGASSAVLASNPLFLSTTKGLYLTMDKNQVGAGGNFMVQLDNDSTRIDIYYRADNGTTIDTAVVSLPVASHSAEIKHTYNATVLGVINNQTTSNNTFYIQGLAGLRAKVSFPDLKTLITKIGSDVVINRAELVITPTIGSTIPFKAQPKISVYQLDKALQRVPLRDALDASTVNSSAGNVLGQGISVFGGYFTVKNDYHFIITGYVQDLMRNQAVVDYGTYIGAVDTTNTSTVDYFATPSTGGRVIAAGSVTNKSSADYPYRIKLNIIYTKINK
jgi:hypothetical protein